MAEAREAAADPGTAVRTGGTATLGYLGDLITANLMAMRLFFFVDPSIIIIPVTCVGSSYLTAIGTTTFACNLDFPPCIPVKTLVLCSLSSTFS